MKCKVKQILIDKGISFMDFACKINMNYEQLKDIINNRYNDVGLNKAHKIAKGLNMTIEEIWEEID
jgi:DNA-binding XRE family transcriptional regulator